MAERRARRRLTAWLMAAVLGAASVLTSVTPAHAATCELTFKANYWGMVNGQYRWQVDAEFDNTGTTPSTNWWAIIAFAYSQGAVVHQYWNVTRPTTYQWNPASWNKVIPVGQSARFGFAILVPNTSVSPLPTAVGCTITY
ncbi:cellulose binding domain-containing protein [Herbidospora mongoliensis]|uniref:cellulose binding domain-containing protein n=1 Tax=Herbidospora mongoliensis TaxID=688067 RepID=UPI000A033D0E|nr:cellulose binding domain-containing protein [Herbidospora mongoliensis]